MTEPRRRLVAEGLGTGLLLVVIVGSGIAVERLGTDGAGQLFAHAISVGIALAALIVLLGPVSGAHFNPAVTLGFLRQGALTAREAVAYASVQVIGAIAGVIFANWSFGESALDISTTARAGAGVFGAELLATLVLVLLILGLVRVGNVAAVAPAVGAWVAAAIVATSSTGFANPAVTIGRMFTDTYTGIEPAAAPLFIVAQLVAAVAAAGVVAALYPNRQPGRRASDPQPQENI